MNADQLKRKWVQFKGDLKQQWDKLADMTCNRSKEMTANVSTKFKNGPAKKMIDDVGGYPLQTSMPDAMGTKVL